VNAAHARPRGEMRSFLDMTLSLSGEANA
jgi:hypothetical protein